MAYGDIYEMTKGFEFPLSARNENGENVVIEKGRNENGDYFCTNTMQKNGWVRMNFYYSNGDYEELYEL